MLEQGPHEANILRDCLRTGRPYPQSIQNAPELRLGLNLFMQAFTDLDSSRMMSMQVGRIPWATIYDYCERIGVSGEQREDVIFQVQAMDVWYINWNKAKNGDS